MKLKTRKKLEMRDQLGQRTYTKKGPGRKPINGPQKIYPRWLQKYQDQYSHVLTPYITDLNLAKLANKKS